MAESSTLNDLQLWAQGPLICNVDSHMMPHYRFQAICNHEGCRETIPFTMGLGKDMRKHYNEHHRLHCKACKKEGFKDKEDLEIHLYSNHKHELCLKCQAPFNLASALAMHIESPKNSCSVPHSALAAALRHYIMRHTGVTDPNSVYSPISCSPGNEQIMVQRLKEFRATLLLAHKRALREMDQLDSERDTEPPQSPASGTLYLHNGVGYNSPVYNNYVSSPDSVLPKSASGAGHGGTIIGPLPRKMSQELIIGRSDQENWDSPTPKEWTCTTCVDAKFNSLSMLLQHVEAKVRDNWWKTMNN